MDLDSMECDFILRGHPGLNWGHFDLQSNALPLSYTPLFHQITYVIIFKQFDNIWRVYVDLFVDD